MFVDVGRLWAADQEVNRRSGVQEVLWFLKKNLLIF